MKNEAIKNDTVVGIENVVMSYWAIPKGKRPLPDVYFASLRSVFVEKLPKGLDIDVLGFALDAFNDLCLCYLDLSCDIAVFYKVVDEIFS